MFQKKSKSIFFLIRHVRDVIQGKDLHLILLIRKPLSSYGWEFVFGKARQNMDCHKLIFVLSFACLNVAFACNSRVKNSGVNPRINAASVFNGLGDSSSENGSENLGCAGSFKLFTASSIMRGESLLFKLICNLMMIIFRSTFLF